MLYLNNRPVPATAVANSRMPATFFQWRSFYTSEPEAIEMIEKSYTKDGTESRKDKYFLLPGRKNTVTRLINDETIEIRKLIGTDGPIEQWEDSIRTEFPVKRSSAAMIGTYVPRFRGSISSVADASSVTESWSRKSQFFDVAKETTFYSNDAVKIELCTLKVEDQERISIAVKASSADAIMTAIHALELSPKANMHFGAFLAQI